MISLPNVRQWRIVVDLVLRDKWMYVDEGILDRTQLRSFTRTEGQRLVEASGLVVEQVLPNLGHRVQGWLPSGIARRSAGLLTYQWIYVATLPTTANKPDAVRSALAAARAGVTETQAARSAQAMESS